MGLRRLSPETFHDITTDPDFASWGEEWVMVGFADGMVIYEIKAAE